MAEVIYPELSYQIIGALFDAYNEIGPSHHEKYCQRAVASMLTQRRLPFVEQWPVDLVVNGQVIGKYFLDFLVDGKVIVELKVGDRFRKSDFLQAQAYLRATRIQLAILARFGRERLISQRVLNLPDYQRS